MERQKAISRLLKNWCSSLRSCRVDQILDNYAPEALLLPTFSSRILRGRDELKKYFEFLVQFEPACTVQSENIKIFSDISINSGAYTFYLVKGGDRASVPARFTFVYRKQGEDWLIVEHHSSLFPEGD